MHERALVSDLADAMQLAAGGAITEVQGVAVTVGSLAPVTGDAMAVALRDEARRRWGVDIDVHVRTSAVIDAAAGIDLRRGHKLELVLATPGSTCGDGTGGDRY